MNLILIDFKSKQCKVNQHKKCSKRWKGLSFEVICNCSCHEKEEMLDESRGLSNTKLSPSEMNKKYV